MPAIYLTDFVDFVARSGQPKLTKVQELFTRPDYHPATDFYKPLRDGLREHHRQGGTRAEVPGLLPALTADAKKQASYALRLSKYHRFWGRRTFEWFEPTASFWQHQELQVRVAPHLGLRIDGQPHLIQVWFKDDQLKPTQVQLILSLMELQLGPQLPAGTVLGLLQLSTGKLHVAGPRRPGLDLLLAGEADSFLRIWDGLEQRAA
ncbi:hypothetical protein [Hymenobacter pini]|uniref:hypothetical protein n=1 Tax=Hymenobacter pini TaxID=2880879 RepID=UPI001CF2349D|nr:hypothetical protein [Hymenobacter pini]MCA8831910.1 hypothetical protein [Hymenobacter pini]